MGSLGQRTRRFARSQRGRLLALHLLAFLAVSWLLYTVAPWETAAWVLWGLIVFLHALQIAPASVATRPHMPTAESARRQIRAPLLAYLLAALLMFAVAQWAAGAWLLWTALLMWHVSQVAHAGSFVRSIQDDLEAERQYNYRQLARYSTGEMPLVKIEHKNDDPPSQP
jgi:hypothetical protein